MRKTSICIVILVFFCITACTAIPSKDVPQSGIWQNAELGITLFFDNPHSGNARMTICGNEIVCGVGNERFSRTIIVFSEEKVDGVCRLGEELFCGDCYYLTDSTVTIIEKGTGKEYVFERVNKAGPGAHRDG